MGWWRRSLPGGRGPRWPRGVPGVQPPGAGRERVERVLRVAQVRVVALGPVQMLAGQVEPQRPGEAVDPSGAWPIIAQLSSVSYVQERRLMLADPTMAHVSSMTQTFAWT